MGKIFKSKCLPYKKISKKERKPPYRDILTKPNFTERLTLIRTLMRAW